MSELNEKLIDYGGLEHFRDLLLNDSGTTSTSTWSSSKINEEKGYEFDKTVGGFATKYVNSEDENNVYVATNTASKSGAFAEGYNTTASGNSSHSEGAYTTAQNITEHAEGNYNISHKASDTYDNAGNTQHSVGIGSSSAHKNAFEIMQNGDMYVYGVGGYKGTDTKVQDATIKTLQEYIASLEARIAALEKPNA